MISVSGWIETESGVELFSFVQQNIHAVAKDMIELFPEDAGETDMEATDQDGNDVTIELLKALETTAHKQ